jgi:hypothetical protein
MDQMILEILVNLLLNYLVGLELLIVVVEQPFDSNLLMQFHLMILMLELL